MKQLKLNVAMRNDTGRRKVLRMCKEGYTPGVIYGRHITPITISVKSKDLERLLQKTASCAIVINLTGSLPGVLPVIIRSAQRHPLNDNIIHVDFQAVSGNRLIKFNVPVNYKGNPVGVQKDNGLLEIHSRSLTVSCLPHKLPNVVEIDISNFNVGDLLRVKDLMEISEVVFEEKSDKIILSCTQSTSSRVEAESESSSKSSN